MASDLEKCNRNDKRPSSSAWAFDYALVFTWLSAALFGLAITMPFVTMKPGAGGAFAEIFIEFLSGQRFVPQTWSLLGGIINLFRAGETTIGSILLLFSVAFPAAKLFALFVIVRRFSHGDRRVPTYSWRLLRSVGSLVLLPIHSLFDRLFAFPDRLLRLLLLWLICRFEGIVPQVFQRILMSAGHGVWMVGKNLAVLVNDVRPKTGIEWLELLGPWSMADVLVVAVLVVTFKEFPGGTTVTSEPGYWVFLGSVLGAMFAVLFAKGYYLGLTKAGPSLRSEIDLISGSVSIAETTKQLPFLAGLQQREEIIDLLADFFRSVPTNNGNLSKHVLPRDAEISPKTRLASEILRIVAGIALLIGCFLRAVTSFATRELYLFPTPSVFLFGPIRIVEFDSALPRWAIIACAVGLILIILALILFVASLVFQLLANRCFVRVVCAYCDRLTELDMRRLSV